MTISTTPTHPDARCGHCNACRHVEATKRIVLSHSAPAGPGITQREADLWNDTLRDNPCEQPLVIVNLRKPPSTVRARLLKDRGGEHEAVQIMTAEYGQICVDRSQVEPWVPERCLDGVSFEHLRASLKHVPSTWYPALFEALTYGAYDANTFRPFGASMHVRRLEAEMFRKDTDESPPGSEL